MPTIEYTKERGLTFSVLSDGKFHQTVPETTEGAVKRDYELKDGTKGSKWELIAQSISGRIANVGIYEGDFGKQVQIDLGSGKELISIYLSTLSPFGEDFMKKLPNIDMEKDVRIVPYAFEDEATKKKRRGLTIYQDKDGEDIKVQDFYHKKDGEKSAAVNGYPEVPAESKEWDSEDWKLYFATARKFMLEQMKKHLLFNRTAKTEGMSAAFTPESYPTEESDPLGIPF